MKTAYLPKPTNLDRLTYVRGLLVMNRITTRKIAQHLKVTEPAVSRVLHGSMRSRRIQGAVAELLNLDFIDVWGDTP